MGRSKMKKLTLKDGDFELKLERCAGDPIENFSQILKEGDQISNCNCSHLPSSVTSTPFSATSSTSLTLEENKENGVVEQKVVEEDPSSKDEESKYISSPMVGTFYQSASPEDSSFVKVGDQVNEDTVVCIIEAMKVMNEVKSGVKGKVVEFLVENGHPVEFGTKMFRVT